MVPKLRVLIQAFCLFEKHSTIFYKNWLLGRKIDLIRFLFMGQNMFTLTYLDSLDKSELHKNNSKLFSLLLVFLKCISLGKNTMNKLFEVQ